MPARKTVAQKKRVMKPSDSRLQQWLLNYRNLRREAEIATEAAAIVKDKLIPQLAGRSERLTVTDEDGVTISATYVGGVMSSIDEQMLRDEVGDEAYFEHCTTRSFNMKMLEAAVASGKIAPGVIERCTVETPKAPYLRINEKGGGS